MFRASLVLFVGVLLSLDASLRAQQPFPAPNAKLHDEKHKVTAPPPPAEGKYGEVDGRRFVRIDPTPTRINSLAFSSDGRLLAAAKDFGRLVVWDVASESVSCIIDTGFTRVGLVAISPGNHFIAAAQIVGAGVKIFQIPDGKLVRFVNTENSVINRLLYTSNPERLIFSTSGTYVFDPESGAQVAEFTGEWLPVLSTDGKTLMTLSSSAIVLRNVSDWTPQETLPKLTPYAWPVFLDTALGLYVFGDGTDSHLFVPARLSDGKMLPGVKLANLPESYAMYETAAFAAIDAKSGLIFGHSGDRLWALDPKTGHLCLSPDLLSASGALSPDGSILAGAIDSEAPTDNQKKAGVGLWKTDALTRACHLP